MKYFWDIESYYNFFCCGFLDDNDHLEMHYIVNSDEDANKVKEACKASGYTFTLYNLKTDARRLIHHFKKQIPSSGEPSLLSDFLGIEEKEVKVRDEYYIAYNSLSYDIQMIDFLSKSVIANRVQTTTESLREFSNTLIDDTGRRVSTRDYEMFANQIDSAFLNEAMIEHGKPTIGLKTLVGVKGGSIIESEANKTGYSDDIFNETLYNINDISELRDVVFPDKMELTMKVRQQLLDSYPSLRANGVTLNSTSAKFVEYIVAPDGPIEDTPTVNFMYPAKHVAEKYGVEQFDVLEDTKHWYVENVYKVVSQNNPHAARKNLAKFMSVYNFYASFRGKNWNESARHLMKHGIPANPKAKRRELLKTYGTFLPLIDKYGNDSYTYENFSAGGIHGAEINKDQLLQDRAKIKYLKDTYKYISAIPKKEVSAALLNLIKVQSRTQHLDYPISLSHEIPSLYYKTSMVDKIVDPEDFTPFMVSSKSGTEDIIGRYKYTSIGHSVHQDFAGYYPMLLINLGAFYDGNGIDRYEEVYNLRIAIKSKLKELEYGSPEWEETDIIQEGYKLILNSASGVLDGSFDTNLRANNKALTLRIVGQLFTFRIAAALAIEGATIPSSNTDGIYVFNIDYNLNTEIVNRELKKLLVKIDPEPVFLVSKDTNNRMETENGKVVSARGGTLTSWKGARVDKRLSHPALVDRVLTIYLQNENIVNKMIDKDLIRQALHSYMKSTSKREFVLMTSWVLRSTSGSIFIDDSNTVYPGTIRGWLSNTGVKLEKYGTKSAKKSATYDSWANTMFGSTRIGSPEIIEKLSDLGILEKYFTRAVTVNQYKALDPSQSFYAVAVSKISNLSDSARLYIDNRSILNMTDDEIDHIYNQINEDEYVDMIAKFAKVWHNQLLAS